MTFNDFKTKVKSLLLYDQDSDDSQVVSYIDALIVEWMYEAMFYVDNYRVGNTDTFLPAGVDATCDGGRVDLPAELYKLESVAIVKHAEDAVAHASMDGVDDEIFFPLSTINPPFEYPDIALTFSARAAAGEILRTGRGNSTQTLDNEWETHTIEWLHQGFSLIVGTDNASDFTRADWSEMTLSVRDTGDVLAHWKLDESSDATAGSLEGVTAIDQLGGNDGTYSGCTAVPAIIGCETVIDLDPLTWDQRDEILNGKHCNKYTIDSRATEIYFRPVPEDNEETGETQWLRVEWEGTKTDYSGQETVPYGFDAAKNCADFINMNLAIKKNDKPAKATRFEKMFDRGMQRLFKTQRAKSQQG